MWKFARHRPIPATLDVNAEGLRLMQLARDEDGLRVVAATRRRLDVMSKPAESATLTDALQRAMDAAPLTTRRVIAALPADILTLRTVRVSVDSIDSGESLETIVRSEKPDSFPFDLADATLRCIDAGRIKERNGPRAEIIAAAAPREAVSAFVEKVEAAGLKVESLRLAPLAAMRCARRGLLPSAAHAGASHAVIDIGTFASTVIIHHEDHPSFLRRIPLGGRQIDEAIAKKLDLTLDEAAQLRRRLAGAEPADSLSRDEVGGAVFDAMRGLLEKLADQVGLCFRYYAVTFRGRQVATISLIGDEVGDPHFLAAFAPLCPVAARIVDPLYGIDTRAMRSADREGRAGEWAICVGLALGAVPENSGASPPLSAVSRPSSVAAEIMSSS